MRNVIAVLLLSVMVLASACNRIDSWQEKEYQNVRMVMTINGTESGIDTQIAKRIAEQMSEKTGGAVRIEVYPRDQLAGGNTPRGVEMISDGAVDLAAYVSGTLSLIDERLAVGTIPWTFHSYQEAREVIDASGGAYYEKVLTDHGLVYLGSAHNGMRQLSNNRKPVKTPEDLEDLKIRVLGGESYLSFFEALGADPTPMSLSELPAAIRQGTVDGQENGFYLMDSLDLDEIQPYLTVWNYTYENYIIVANNKTFQSLEPETQGLLREIVRDSCEWGRDLVEKNEKILLQQFMLNGMEIIQPDETQLKPFQERTKPVVEQLKRKYGAEACEAFRIY